MDPRIPLQINSIYNYIADNLVNEPAAYRIKSVIERKFSTISTFPNGGTSILSFDDIAVEFSNVRKVTADKYVILYEYHEENDDAVIQHIFHQKQDYGKIFKNKEKR